MVKFKDVDEKDTLDIFSKRWFKINKEEDLDNPLLDAKSKSKIKKRRRKNFKKK